MRKKTLGITNSLEAKEHGVEFFGDTDAWKLICKAYHEEEGWMKSTSAMEIPGVGCLVKVSVQQLSKGGDYQSVSEAITAIPDVVIDVVLDKDRKKVIGRRLVSANTVVRMEPDPGKPEPEPIDTFADASKADTGPVTIDETDAGKEIDPTKTKSEDAAQDENEESNIDGMGPLVKGDQVSLE